MFFLNCHIPGKLEYVTFPIYVARIIYIESYMLKYTNNIIPHHSIYKNIISGKSSKELFQFFFYSSFLPKNKKRWYQILPFYISYIINNCNVDIKKTINPFFAFLVLFGMELPKQKQPLNYKHIYIHS